MFTHDQLDLEDTPTEGERRLRLDSPDEKSGRGAQTFRELYQGYPGVARRPAPRTRPFEPLIAVALPGDATICRVGDGYEVRGALCALPVPAQAVRLVHLGYREHAAKASNDPLLTESDCEDLVDLAGLELFTDEERLAVSSGDRSKVSEAIARALDRGDQLQALVFVLLQQREAEAWEKGTAEERRALHLAAYARLRAVLRCLPHDLIERQPGTTPERVTAGFGRSLAGFRVGGGG